MEGGALQVLLLLVDPGQVEVGLDGFRGVKEGREEAFFAGFGVSGCEGPFGLGQQFFGLLLAQGLEPGLDPGMVRIQLQDLPVVGKHLVLQPFGLVDLGQSKIRGNEAGD